MKTDVMTFLNLKGLIDLHARNEVKFTGPLLKLELSIKQNLGIPTNGRLEPHSNKELSPKDAATMQALNDKFKKAKPWA